MVKYLIKLSRWLLLLLVVIFFAVQVPATFLTFSNFSNVLRVSAFLVILALGQGIVIISGNGGIDLSNGSVAALSSCISALMIAAGVHVVLAVLAGQLVGAAIGLVNGLLVSVIKLPPFVATYGMDSAVRGAAYILMSGTIVYGVFPDSFRTMGSGTFLGIGVPIYIAVICAIVLIFMMVKTIWGRNVYSIGNNKRAAEISGVGVNRVQLSVFILNGVIAAFVGILYVARLNAAEPVLGTEFALQSIGAVVLGGISLSGGKGNLLNAVVGAILISVINNGLTLLGVSSHWQEFVFGAVIVAAILLEVLMNFLEKRYVKSDG